MTQKRKIYQTIEPLTPIRKGIFWGITLVSPFFILIVCELLLGTFNYGDNLDLVITKHAFGKEWYTLNSQIGKRYFSQQDIAIPEPYDDLFEVKKRPNTKRIFMLGESTMAGYPYDYNATAPRLLQDRLQLLLPQFNIEVINAGLAAVNSYTVMDFIGELVNYEPDAFIVYVGHNEFYGAFGTGSTESVGNSRWLIKTYLAIRKFKVIMALRDMLLWLNSGSSDAVRPNDSTLMAKMVKEKTIHYGSVEYRLAMENFEENLKSIISTANEHHVPIIFSTLTSNIRDQKPLFPSFSGGTDEDIEKKWSKYVSAGNSFEQQGKFEMALKSYEEAIRLDSMQAEAHFRIGKCLDTLAHYEEAKKAYQKARNYDALRFRASTEFNNIIRNTCNQLNVPYADADSSFDQASSHGIVGTNLMLEHLHPNFDGYYLLAKTFFQTVVAHAVIAESSAFDWKANRDDADMKKYSGVTEFDAAVARYRVSQLTKGWPFNHASSATEAAPPPTPITKIAEDYVLKKLTWSQARFDLASFYTKEKNYDAAIAEYGAVTKVVPLYYYPWLLIGDVYQLQGKTTNAEESYQKALDLDDSPFVHVRLGMLYFELDNTDKAIQEFELTLDSEIRGKEKMKPNEVSLLRYFLGASYGKRGDLANARRNLELAIQINPENHDARNMLAQIP